MTLPWPAQCLVGGKGKRYARDIRKAAYTLYIMARLLIRTSTHTRPGFRARQGIINEC